MVAINQPNNSQNTNCVDFNHRFSPLLMTYYYNKSKNGLFLIRFKSYSTKSASRNLKKLPLKNFLSLNLVF